MADRATLSRRGFISAAIGAALIAGFDPRSGRWVREALADGEFDSVPPLDGVLYTDPRRRGDSSGDEGNIVTHVPIAVLYPGSVNDVVTMVRFCRERGIKVAARGQHHAMYGQSLTGGLVIEMRALNTIHSIGPTQAVVDAGVTWKDLLLATRPYGVRPPGVTGFTALSIGGTLSVGGCPMTNRGGALVDRVSAVRVVTGEGQLLDCSATQNTALFEAVLGGLGQCAIIVGATVDLVLAVQYARTYLLSYTDAATFFRDFRTLLNRGEIPEVYNVAMPPGSSTFVYQLNATVFYDLLSPPNDLYLLRGLDPVATATAVQLNRDYVNYALAVDYQIEALRTFASWDTLVKPWYDVWLPDSAVEQHVTSVVSGLTPEDVGPSGFVLLFAQRRSRLTRPFFRVPAASSGDWVFLFDVATASSSPGPNPAFADRMLARNRTWFDSARSLGGVRYSIGALAFTVDDWAQHFGELWDEFRRRKHRFDPQNILTPGPGIF